MRAAQAIERAALELGAARDVRHVDTLQYTTKMFRNLYSRAYIDMVNKAPDVLGWLYDQMDKPWKNERRRLAFDKLNTRPFVRFLREYQPDITICTHFLPAEIISWLKAKRKLDTRQAIVITDFDVHAMWLVHHFERYFVALDETRAHLEKLGIPSARITASGIPIDPVFARPKDKVEMRRKYDLRLDAPTILISAGGFGVGRVGQIVESLLDLKHPVQILAICGRNDDLQRSIDKQAARIPADSALSIKSIGFTTDIDEYMSASDILLGKPGGLTSSEALARGLAFVIVNPIPGQEERNSDHLLEQGAAIRCNNLPVLAYKIDRLLDDPASLLRMQVAAGLMARPHAAYEIVNSLQSFLPH
jgi:processive 1,2-diacylglycerol beta-glucosyltransferase